MTISELAGTLKVPAQDLLALAKANGLEVSSVDDEIDDVTAQRIARYAHDNNVGPAGTDAPAVDGLGAVPQANPTVRDLAENLDMNIDRLLKGIARIGIRISDPDRELTSEEGRMILDNLHVIEADEPAGDDFEINVHKAEKAEKSVKEEPEEDISVGQDDIDALIRSQQAAMTDEPEPEPAPAPEPEPEPQRPTLREIAGKFDVTVDELMGVARQQKLGIATPDQPLNDKQVSTLERYLEQRMLADAEQELAVAAPAPEEPRPEPSPERAAVEMIAGVEEKRPFVRNPFFWLSVGMVPILLVMIVATLMVLRSQPAAETPAQPVPVPTAVVTGNREPDTVALRLIWKMDAEGFYKSAHEMVERFKKDYPDSDLLEDVYFKDVDILYKWEKYPPSNQYRAAVEAANEAVARYPQSNKAPWGLYMVGQANAKMNLHEEALRAYKELQSTYPGYGQLDQVQFAAAESCLNLGEYAQAEKEYLKILSEFPDTPLKSRTYFQIALCLDRQERYDDALSAYKRFVRLYPEDMQKDEATLAMGTIYFKQGQYGHARQAFRKTIGRYPYDAWNDQSLFMISECLARENDYKGARDVLDELIFNYPDSEYAKKALFKEGDYFYEEGDAKKAVEYYEAALNKYPDHELARPTTLLLGTVYVESREFDKAIGLFRDRLTNYPKDAGNDKIRLLLGKAYYEKGIHVAAVNAFDQVIAEYPASPLVEEAHSLKADAYFAAELFSEARYAYTQLINKFPETERGDFVYYQLGLCAFNLNQYDEAIDYLQRGMEQYPLSKYRYRSRFVIARTHAGRGENDKAIEHLERLVNNEYLSGSDVFYDAAYELGRLLHEKGEHKKAAGMFEEVINGQVGHAFFLKAVKARGEVYAAMGRTDDMIKSYREVIALLEQKEAASEAERLQKREDVASFYAAMGDARFKEKRFKEALEHYRKAYDSRKESPRSDWVIYQIANSYNELGEYNDALTYYELLEEVHPDSYWARQLDFNRKKMSVNRQLKEETFN